MVLVRAASGSGRGSSTRLLGVVLATALLAAACGDDGATDSGSPSPSSAPGQSDRESSTGTDEDQQFPDVLNVEVEHSGDTYDFEVTISSPYDTPERYADGWRVMDADDGTVYGEHELAHDHANEQPFTRIQRGVEIPDGVDEAVVEGRDQANGYGGKTVTVPVPE